MTIETVWFIVVMIGFWLLNPIPWLIIGVVMMALRQWWGRRQAFVVAVTVGAVAGAVTMLCLGGCRTGEVSLVAVALVALCDALIAAFLVSGLLDLAGRLLGRRASK